MDEGAGDRDWESTLDSALGEANLPTLLMVLAHLSGDDRWLSGRYRCGRAQGLDDNDSGGMPTDVADEIRAAARDVILAWRRGNLVARAEPDDGQFARMMEVSTGEPSPEGYGALVASGFRPSPIADPGARAPIPVPQNFLAVIVGAGVAGLCAAIGFQTAGIPFVVIEKNETLGGTWHENRYPGAGVDTPSHIYSFSFAKQDWRMHFALQGEIQAYFEGVADRFGIRRHCRFGSRVRSAEYDEAAKRWTVLLTDASGAEMRLDADILVAAVGYLNVPKTPRIPGLDAFEGPCFHTARWPADLDLRGRRVAVIGNGATAMQVVPAIADTVGELTVFQRSKQWAAPFERFRQHISPGKRFLLREVPYYQEWYRQRLLWIFNDRVHASLQIDPHWAHRERSINRQNDRHREFFTAYVKAELGDRQDLLDDVLPSFPPFAKRMLLDNGWFRTMTKPNVRLVSSGARRITRDAVEAGDGRSFPADIIVIATGFDAVNMLASFDLHGRGGRSIRDAWKETGPRAFLGTSIPGFPNFFMLSGPNTGLGHGGSIVAAVESQVEYVLDVIRQAVAAHGPHFEIEVREDIHDRYNADVEAAHGRMIWSHRGADNWYRDEQGRVILTTPFRNDENWLAARRGGLDDYRSAAA